MKPWIGPRLPSRQSLKPVFLRGRKQPNVLPVTISASVTPAKPHQKTDNQQIQRLFMARTKKNNGDDLSPVSSFQHGDAARLNIPEATEAQTGLSKGKKRTYSYSPHLS